VDIDIAVCVEQGVFQVAVFDVVPPSAVKMTHTTASPRRSSDMLRHGCEIHRRIWAIAFRLGVGAGIVMAGEAVNVVGISELECCVSPPITDMTLVTGFFVTGDANTIVVENIPLSDITNSTSVDVFLPLPVPVRGPHHLGGPFCMTGDARSRHLGG
jgi:hypothetical protein